MWCCGYVVLKGVVQTLREQLLLLQEDINKRVSDEDKLQVAAVAVGCSSGSGVLWNGNGVQWECIGGALAVQCVERVLAVGQSAVATKIG